MTHHPGPTAILRLGEEGKGEVADDGERLRCVPLADSARILAHGHVADAEQLILDTPVRSDEFQQPSRRRLPRGRLVIPTITSTDLTPLIVRSRRNRNTCITPGQS